MESAARRSSGGGILEGFYRVVMRRTPVYVTFVIAGALLAERVRLLVGSKVTGAGHLEITFVSCGCRAVDYGVHKLWEKNNVGKRYEDISVLGQRPVDE